jgi:hypothetical protein
METIPEGAAPPPDDLARRLVVLSMLGKRVAEAVAETKDRLAGSLTVGDVKKPTHPDDPRLRLGSVTFAAGKVSAVVTDPAALAAWLGRRYPGKGRLDWVPADKDEFEAFRETYAGERVGHWIPAEGLFEAVLAASRAAGEPMSPDGDLDVPGVKVSEGEPYLSVRPATSVPDHAWRSVLAETAKEVTDGSDA